MSDKPFLVDESPEGNPGSRRESELLKRVEALERRLAEPANPDDSSLRSVGAEEEANPRTRLQAPLCPDCGEPLELVRRGNASICRDCGFTTAQLESVEEDKNPDEVGERAGQALSLFDEVMDLRQKKDDLEDQIGFFSRDPIREKLILALKRSIAEKEERIRQLVGEESEGEEELWLF